jgi:hypothetical protein
MRHGKYEAAARHGLQTALCVAVVLSSCTGASTSQRRMVDERVAFLSLVDEGYEIQDSRGAVVGRIALPAYRWVAGFAPDLQGRYYIDPGTSPSPSSHWGRFTLELAGLPPIGLFDCGPASCVRKVVWLSPNGRRCLLLDSRGDLWRVQLGGRAPRVVRIGQGIRDVAASARGLFVLGNGQRPGPRWRQWCDGSWTTLQAGSPAEWDLIAVGPAPDSVLLLRSGSSGPEQEIGRLVRVGGGPQIPLRFAAKGRVRLCISLAGSAAAIVEVASGKQCLDGAERTTFFLWEYLEGTARELRTNDCAVIATSRSANVEPPERTCAEEHPGSVDAELPAPKP